jgi:muramoyltetrapeptide carboxypeptidase
VFLKPNRLNYGDTIGIVAPASAPPDPKSIDRSLVVLHRLGFKTRLARHARKRWGFLAGNDRERAADLMQMFADRKVQAIVCVRGGYGSARLSPLLDYEVIRRHPKIFIGYSDITSLHCALLNEAGLISFHGPMLNSDFVQENFPDFTLQSFLRTVMEPVPAGSVWGKAENRKQKTESRKQKAEFGVRPPAHLRRGVSILRPGRASGRLIGGNITLLCATLGTPWQPSFKNKILFLEDLKEEPYRYDRSLTHLLNAGLLQQVAGIAIGVNKDCTDPKAKKAKEYRQTLEDVFRDRLLPLKVPIVMGLPFGHIPYNATLPIGVRATLDAQKGDLVIEEAAVG